jgi:hypothetical protein
VVSNRFAAGEVLALVLVLANMWQQQSGDFLELAPDNRRRTTVIEAVRRLVAP